jgi:hypothetical protein
MDAWLADAINPGGRYIKQLSQDIKSMLKARAVIILRNIFGISNRFGVVASRYAILVCYTSAMNPVLSPFSHPCYNAVQR